MQIAICRSQYADRNRLIAKCRPPNAAHAPKGAVWRIQSARGFRATCGGIAPFSNDAAPMLPRSPVNARRAGAIAAARSRVNRGADFPTRVGCKPRVGKFLHQPGEASNAPRRGEAFQSWSLLNGRLADSTQNTAGAAKSVFDRP